MPWCPAGERRSGPHALGVTFLQTNFAPVLDLDQHFMRDTVQTGPTPGFTYFPHVGTVRIEGPFNATQAEDSPSRHKIFICRPTTAADETACATKIITNLATKAFRRPATSSDVAELVEFYKQGRKENNFDNGIEMALARLLAAPKFIYRIEAEPANVNSFLRIWGCRQCLVGKSIAATSFRTWPDCRHWPLRRVRPRRECA